MVGVLCKLDAAVLKLSSRMNKPFGVLSCGPEHQGSGSLFDSIMISSRTVYQMDSIKLRNSERIYNHLRVFVRREGWSRLVSICKRMMNDDRLAGDIGYHQFRLILSRNKLRSKGCLVAIPELVALKSLSD